MEVIQNESSTYTNAEMLRELTELALVVPVDTSIRPVMPSAYEYVSNITLVHSVVAREEEAS